MTARVLAMALLLLATSSSLAWSSHLSSESARNEYRPPTSEATDPQVHVPPVTNSSADKPIDMSAKTNVLEGARKKRDYGPYVYSYTVWTPAQYDIHRPYYIPIWGAPGRLPIFYPPQPYLPQGPGLLNPGAPPHNPFHGPSYLPPATPSPPSPPEGTNNVEGTTVPNFDERFGFPGMKEEMKPVWDRVEPTRSTTQPPPQGVPTRRPATGKSTTHPPLIRPNGGGGGERGGEPSGSRPQRPPTQNRPPPAQGNSARPLGPSACVWAIISCCSAAGEISYECFDQRGCPGAFWDNSPCENDFARAAIASALNFYEN